MFREQVPAGTGMIFRFDRAAPHSFWMKNCLVPLDIAWLDDAMTIVHLAESVPPCREEPCPGYAPVGRARYVIELASGSDGASAGVRTHAAHVAAAATSVSQRADQIVDLARQILAAQDYLRASRMVEQLQALCEDLTTGADASGDGVISLDEGGLQHVRQHMELMAQGEGLR